MRVDMRFGGVLKFKKVDPAAKIYYPMMKGDVGYDLAAITDAVVKARSSLCLKTGLQIEIPEDYWGVIRTRSGYGVKKDVQLLHGTIDASFRGEIIIKVYNHGGEDFQIVKGDRIAQLVLLPKIILPLKEVTELTKTERGFKGLGSTGK